jgi:hypothetical protein
MDLPIPYRLSLRECRAVDGTPEWRMHFHADISGPNHPGPVMRCGRFWPNNEQLLYLGRLIAAHENAILTFSALDVGVAFFRHIASKKRAA